MAEWMDVSVPLRDGMVHWPNDPPVRIQRHLDLEHGDPCNLTVLSMSAHSGTHMDAPLHFLERREGIDRMPIDAGIGPARVIRIRDRAAIRAATLREQAIRRGERILLRTRNSSRAWWTEAFAEDFVHLTWEAADYLAGRGVRTVGIDYLSVAGFHDDTVATHRALLEAGVWIIEGLDLSRAAPGTYDMICVPMKIDGADGAPARAFLRPRRVAAMPRPRLPRQAGPDPRRARTGTRTRPNVTT